MSTLSVCPSSDFFDEAQRRQHPLLSSFNHLKYDEGSYRVDLGQSRGPGSYQLETPATHCTPCLASDARMVMGTSGHTECGNRLMVDIDSELLGITRKASRSPACQFQKGTPECAEYRTSPDCSSVVLDVQDTRLNNPSSTLRGTGWNRWQWLCRNPQEHAIQEFESGIDTTILTKDNHRPLVSVPLDQTVFLPPRKNESPEQSAPKWQTPRCSGDAEYDPNNFVNPIPTMHWRTCKEVSRIQQGCSSP